MKVLHVCAGWDDTNGVAVAARLLAREQVARGDEVSFGVWALPSKSATTLAVPPRSQNSAPFSEAKTAGLS